MLMSGWSVHELRHSEEDRLDSRVTRPMSEWVSEWVVWQWTCAWHSFNREPASKEMSCCLGRGVSWVTDAYLETGSIEVNAACSWGNRPAEVGHSSLIFFSLRPLFLHYAISLILCFVLLVVVNLLQTTVVEKTD